MEIRAFLIVSGFKEFWLMNLVSCIRVIYIKILYIIHGYLHYTIHAFRLQNRGSNASPYQTRNAQVIRTMVIEESGKSIWLTCKETL